ncbi:Arginyl-tRNA synthetase [Aspergillus alliaceus]|uniref:Arginyl-tRNA synthetase n=1 Tax=Petromyces alliaceus TaxID=209559 RepID=A0A8H6E4C5_PETAA|nr:Arginyl-tRNA synthetase [Aspergillus burnettii]
MHEVMKTDQAKYERIEGPENTADILGISAVLVQDMASKRFILVRIISFSVLTRTSRINGYSFDRDRVTSLEGDTGPYLQCSDACLGSIIYKANIPSEQLREASLSMLQEKHAIIIIQKLA